MASLSKKQLREAAPLEALPFELTVQYGLPTLHGTVALVRTKLGAFADDLAEQAARIGSKNDQQNIEFLREKIATVVDGAVFPMQFDCMVDEYTGTRFKATVRDRRMG